MDIVERLRERTDSSVLLLSDPPQRVKDALCQEAAAEIEQLRNIVDRLSDWKEVNGVRVLMKDYYETEIERLREEAKANKDNDYHQGRSDGEETGYRMGYDDGHKDGLREGYEDGYKDGLREVE